MTENDWYRGNANDDASDRRGWLLGHFMEPAGGVRTTKDVEIKWGVHPAGEKRADWTSDDQRTTVVLLISGRFRLDLTEGGEIVLERQGDYAVWRAGIDHTWQAIENSVVLTVRWPSLPI